MAWSFEAGLQKYSINLLST